MANRAVTAFTTTTTVSDTDVIPVVTDPSSAATSKKITIADHRSSSLNNLLTTRGDLPYRAASAPARLAVGAAGAYLGSDGTDPLWRAKTDMPVESLNFPDAQVSSADANSLDDYEESTFTPGISFGGGTTDITYTTQVGRYTKIGNRVLVNGYVVLSSNGSSTGTTRITGLPFTSQNTASAFCPVALRCDGLTGISGMVMAYIEVNATTIAINQLGTGTAALVAETNVTDTGSFMFAAQYETAT